MKDNGKGNNFPFSKTVLPTTSPIAQPRLSHQAPLSSTTTYTKANGSNNVNDGDPTHAQGHSTPNNPAKKYGSNSPYSPYNGSAYSGGSSSQYGQPVGTSSPYNPGTNLPQYSPVSPKADIEGKKKIPTFLEQKTSVPATMNMKGSYFMN